MAPVRGQRGQLLLLLHVWLLLSHHHLGAASLQSRYDVLLWDQVLASAAPLESFSDTSLTVCAIKCHTLSSCWAFNHHQGLCQLLPRDLQVCQASGELQPMTAKEGGVFAMPSRGCAVRTCLEMLELNPAAASGVTQLTGWTNPVYCDQQLDGGGWTLMLTAVSQTWTPDDTVTLVTGRNQETPTIEDDYSILAEGDRVLSCGTGDRFLYRLESQAAPNQRRLWGGIWSAPRSGSIVRYGPEVVTQLVKRFNDWEDSSDVLEPRLPWINTGYFTGHPQTHYVMSTTSDTRFWGTLISKQGIGFSHSPWMHHFAPQSGTVLYWIKENQ